MRSTLEARIASRYSSTPLRLYARSKLRTDPVYAAVFDVLDGSSHPILDIGCGIGLLAFYLRERGLASAITGLDTDRVKVEAAKEVAGGDDSLEFRVGDARDSMGDFTGHVILLDLIHYLAAEDQRELLGKAAARTAPGAAVIIRDCIRDTSWRYRATWLEERFAKTIGWLKVDRLNFPTLNEIAGPFRDIGFTESIAPLWGRTPFNNYLFVFRRPS